MEMGASTLHVIMYILLFIKTCHHRTSSMDVLTLRGMVIFLPARKLQGDKCLEFHRPQFLRWPMNLTIEICN
jgi:hypothetical protein